MESVSVAGGGVSGPARAHGAGDVWATWAHEKAARAGACCYRVQARAWNESARITYHPMDGVFDRKSGRQRFGNYLVHGTHARTLRNGYTHTLLRLRMLIGSPNLGIPTSTSIKKLVVLNCNEWKYYKIWANLRGCFFLLFWTSMSENTTKYGIIHIHIQVYTHIYIEVC